MRRALALYSLLGVMLVGCGGKKTDEPAAVEQATPAALLIEREITGVVRGVRLSEPYGVAVDRQGQLFVVDAGNNRLIKFNEDLEAIDDAGGYGSEAGLLDKPTFVVVDNNLNIVVSDGGNDRVVWYDGRLNFADELRLVDDEEPFKFGYNSGIAVTQYGETWVADRDNHRLAVFDNVSNFDRFVGDYGYSGGVLNSPEKIVYNGRNRFIVCDAGNGRIVFYDDYGNFVEAWDRLNAEYPMALARDPRGRSWVIDGSASRVLCVDDKGKVLYAIGPNLTGSSISLREPSDIAMLPDGRLVIADTGNSRLLICRILYEE